MADLFKEQVPRDLVGAIQMRREVSMMMVNARGIYVGFLLGRERTCRQAILHVQGRMSPSTRLQIIGLDSHEQDLRATASQIMYTCFQTEFRVGPATQNQHSGMIGRHISIGVSYSIST